MAIRTEARALTSRREALRTIGRMAVLPLFGNAGVSELVEIGRRAHAVADQRRTGASPAPRALTAAQYALVVLAAERIIPRTSTPGATDARVADFIDVMLADWYGAADRQRFTAGLNDLDARASAMTGRTFSQLRVGEQTAVLEGLDSELQSLRQSRAGALDDHWFGMLKHLTVWGYYTSRPGVETELRVQLVPGRFDGNAPY